MEIFSTAISGMQRAVARLSAAASRLATANVTPPATRPPVSVVSSPLEAATATAAQGTDIVADIVDMAAADIAYKAGAKVIAAEAKTEKTLLDTVS